MEECFSNVYPEEENFNNDDEPCSENDNSLRDDAIKDAVETDKGSPKPHRLEEEIVIFKMNRNPIKFRLFIINKFSNKYFVEQSCVVLVKGLDGTNFDSHSWSNFHGGHGNRKGITICTCKDSKSCQMKKNKWTCSGKCKDRFCCKFVKGLPIQICLYTGNHDHKINKEGFLDLENIENAEKEQIAREVENEDMEQTAEELDEHEKSSDDESTGYVSSDENDLEEGEKTKEVIKLNKYEQKIYRRCQQNFQGKEIVMAKHNDIIADTNKIYILKKKSHEKIASISRDGYLYQSNTTRKQMRPILDNQTFSYFYNCNGKLVCYNLECPVLNRLTVLNSFQCKKSSPNKCRFCKNELQWEEVKDKSTS